MDEKWKVIPGWPEYAVSSIGNIKRLTAARGAVKGRILKSAIYPHTGYRYVLLQRPMLHQHFLLHRAVALAFLGTPPTPRHQCNHKNGNKLDNNIKNLEWVTHQQNAIHSYHNGLTKKPPTLYGEHVYGCSITTKTAQAILDAPRGYGTGKVLAKKFGTTEAVISFIRTRRTWKHLTPTQPERPDPSLRSS